jgi:hypothetical protein
MIRCIKNGEKILRKEINTVVGGLIVKLKSAFKFIIYSSGQTIPDYDIILIMV